MLKSSWHALLTLPLALALLLRPARAKLVNITVDDYYWDPINHSSSVSYSPYSYFDTYWLVSEGDPCSTCTAHPDPSRAYFGTWHEGLNTGSVGGAEGMYAKFSFEGIAVYVFCIVPRAFSSPDGNTNMTFVLDGARVGTYTRAPNGTDVYEYDVPVYANASLAPGQHTIELYNTPPPKVGTVQNSSLVLLDYIVYTRDNATEPVPANYTPVTVPAPAATATSSSPDPLTSGPKWLAAEIVIPLTVFFIVFSLCLCLFCSSREPRRKAGTGFHWMPPPRILEQGGRDVGGGGEEEEEEGAPLATVTEQGEVSLSWTRQAGPSRLPGARRSVERSEDVNDTHSHAQEQDSNNNGRRDVASLYSAVQSDTTTRREPPPPYTEVDERAWSD